MLEKYASPDSAPRALGLKSCRLSYMSVVVHSLMEEVRSTLSPIKGLRVDLVH